MKRLFLSFALISYAAGATAGAVPAPSAAQKGKDPNERICEKIMLVGSRLAVKRICATRAEWEERRRLDKEAIDRAQVGPNGPCSSVNTHSGAPSC